jgi:hypothetical protein
MNAIPIVIALSGLFLFSSASRVQSQIPADSRSVSIEQMQRVYEEVKTPFKYGIVIRGEEGQLVDCASIFRKNRKWYKVGDQGRVIALATSKNLKLKN